MLKKIKFIAFYDEYGSSEERQFSLAAVNKINYIVTVLNRIGYYVEIISPSWTNKSQGFYKNSKIKYKKYSIQKFNSIGTKNKLLKFLCKKYTLYQLYSFLKKNIVDNETILVYHSTSLYNVLRKLKQKKNINIVLEVEEIYSNLMNLQKEKFNEKKMLKLASKYIFITEILNKKINNNKKPFCICHGTYKIEKETQDKFKDDKIHIVYSGIIDKQKQGAFTALEICKYLNEKYKLHIIGFGNDDNIADLRNKINQNNELNKCIAIFDGKKQGDEYINYIQKCQIGLSTQDPAGKYNESSFPSKILAYLSNGLRVVSVDIPAVKTSKVGKVIYYYKNNNPEDIANVIKNIDLNKKYNSRKLISKLDEEFCKDLEKMLGENNDN